MFPGPLQIALVIALVLLLFGASRVPSIMENLARGARAFKKGLTEDDDKPADKSDTKR
jgi:sec-independent protein translocase protein TatA